MRFKTWFVAFSVSLANDASLSNINVHQASLTVHSIATGVEYTNIILPFIRIIPRMHLLIYAGPGYKFTARRQWTIPKQTWSWRSPTWTMSRIVALALTTFSAGLNFGIWKPLTQLLHYVFNYLSVIRFSPEAVSVRQAFRCSTIFVSPIPIQTLYVQFAGSDFHRWYFEIYVMFTVAKRALNSSSFRLSNYSDARCDLTVWIGRFPVLLRFWCRMWQFLLKYTWDPHWSCFHGSPVIHRSRIACI